MYTQVLSDKKYICLKALFYLAHIYCLMRAPDNALRHLLSPTYAVIAFRIQIGNKIREDHPKGAGKGTGFTAGAAHLVALQMPVSCAFKRVMITGIHAGRFFAVPTDSGKSGVFAQRSHSFILRVIKIPAAGDAFLAFVADIQVHK